MAKDVSTVENIIASRSFFKGRFVLKGNLQIHGKYEGDSLEVDSLLVGKSGKVKTNVIANTVVIEGIVIGSIQANVRILLYPSAKILGDIKTPELVIQNGVVFEGRCQITNNDATLATELINGLYDGE